jgi:tetratricopeptide (TPR) repeat protein
MVNSISFAYRILSIVFLVSSVSNNLFGQSPETTPPPQQDAQNLVVVAKQFYDRKEYERAIEVAMNAVKLLPKDHRPWSIIGNSYLNQWKMKSASEAYAKAAEINPRIRGIWYLKAYADRSRNAREESIIAAKKAIEIDPNYAEAYEIMGESLAMGSKDVKGAIEAFRTSLKLKPNLVTASENLGMHLSVAGDKKEAEEVFRKAMELDPEKMACRFSLGRILVEQGRLSEARQVWNERKFDEKNTIPPFITLLERAEKKKLVSDKLAASPDDPQAILEMGIVEMDGEFWFADGRQKRAIVYFEKALKKNPELVKAQYWICKALVEIADRDKAALAELERQLTLLRKKDTNLATEIDEYRKTYTGSFKVSSSTNDQ